MIFIENTQILHDNLQNIADLKVLGFDLETTGLDPFTDELLLVQLGNEKEQYIIDARKCDISVLKGILEDQTIQKITANGTFEYKWMRRCGNIEPEPLIDVLNAERILKTGIVHFKTQKYFALEGLSDRYLNMKLKKEVRDSFQIHRGSFSHEQLEYAAEDVISPCLIFRQQRDLLTREGLMNTFNLETRVLPVFGDMEFNGIYLDRKRWNKLLKENIKNLDKWNKIAKDMFRGVWDVNLMGDVNLNLNSDEQLLWCIRKLGYDVPNTAEETLVEILPPKVREPIIKYREFQTNVSRYGEGYIENINPVTGRVHTNLHQIGTETGRPASTKPNLLNIKRESDYRSAFRAQNGGKILTNDYDGQEGRIAAEVTGDPTWVEIFNNNQRVHSVVGSKLFSIVAGQDFVVDKSDKEVEIFGHQIKMSDLYAITKNLNFGILYGSGPAKILEQLHSLGIDEAEMRHAKEIFEYHRQGQPILHEKMDEFRELTLERGYSLSLGGRKRYFPRFKVSDMPGETHKDRYQKWKGRRHAQMREGGNMVIQSTGAEQLKESLYLIRREIKKRNRKSDFRIVLAPYDETVCESEKDHEENQELIQKCMLLGQECYQSVVPAAVEGHIKDCWSK